MPDENLCSSARVSGDRRFPRRVDNAIQLRITGTSRQAQARMLGPGWAIGPGCPLDTEIRPDVFGRQKHVTVDVKRRLIRQVAVTSANVHDSRLFEELLTFNSSRDVYADSPTARQNL